MLNKGVPKEVLQTLLGHRSIKTTEIYANWVRKEETLARASLGRIRGLFYQYTLLNEVNMIQPY